jgi:hypothetical protein
LVWLVVGLLIAALVVVGVVVWIVRRRAADTDDFTAIGTAPSASAPTTDADAPSGATAGDPADARPVQRAAGVSPDEALAALQRTVEEVTSKLDAPATERPRVKVPGGPDEQPAVRRGTSKAPGGPPTGAAGPSERDAAGSPTAPPSEPPEAT